LKQRKISRGYLSFYSWHSNESLYCIFLLLTALVQKSIRFFLGWTTIRFQVLQARSSQIGPTFPLRSVWETEEEIWTP